MVRAVASKDVTSPRSSQNTPMPWDANKQPQADDSFSARGLTDRDSRHNSHRDSRDSQRLRIERLGIGHGQLNGQSHSRNDSGNASSTDYANEHAGHPRKHDYDLHAMETSVQAMQVKESKSTIPAPMVTVRSEYPTLNRSRQQQTVTCLVTIEVPEGKWQGQIDETPHTPPVPPLPSDSGIGIGSMHRKHDTQLPPVAYESPDELEEVTEELRIRVDNWHGLEFQRFGKLRMHSVVRVGKDRHSWQELECYLFGEMLICVKEKKNAQPPLVTETGRKLSRCTLKGSILIKKHLRQVHASPDECILTLNLSVAELPTFHLQFQDREKLEAWQRGLRDLHAGETSPRYPSDYDQDTSGTDDEYEARQNSQVRRVPSVSSSYGGPKSATTAATEYSMAKQFSDRKVPPSLHIPIDIVVVIPVSSSMQGLKITLLRDTLRFIVHNLGDRDRMGLVTFGSSGGGVPVVGMTTKTWSGWNKVLNSIRPVGQKSLRADVVDGANVAMDLLMQRKAANPISTILLISDSSTSEMDGVDFVVQRAEAAK
jgi:hypothetical protein